MIDRHSPEGRQLLQALEERIRDKQGSLERPGTDYAQTQFLRGQIKGLRFVLGLITGEQTDDD